MRKRPDGMFTDGIATIVLDSKNKTLGYKTPNKTVIIFENVEVEDGLKYKFTVQMRKINEWLELVDFAVSS